MGISKALKVLLFFLMTALVGVVIGAGFYLFHQSQRTTFFPKTTVNGYDVSSLEPAEIVSIISQDYGSSSVQLKEQDKTAIEGDLASFGYTVNEDALKADLEDVLLKRQNGSLTGLLTGLLSGNHFVVTIPFICKQETLNNRVNASALPIERHASKNAAVMYDQKANEYYIQSEEYGNEFSDSSLQSYVKEKIDAFVNANTPGEKLEIDFPTEIYIKPEIIETDETLNNTVRVFNQFCKAKITYTFGKEEKVLDWNTIQNWLHIVDGEGVLDDQSLYDYVVSLEAEYNTRHYDRLFHTSVGTDITIPSSENDYGYLINEDEEFRQLVADIRSNSEVKREPVYYSTSSDYGNPLYYMRDGRDDLAGTYIEVNLSAQHLWFYKDYNLIVDTDIVSGCVAKKSETKTGAFALAYKESPAVLVGADAADGYRTEVQYWMPFYEGQGLHDATWRGSFGGNIYVNNGSHGCVNMPYGAAEALFSHAKEGMAIIIYK